MSSRHHDADADARAHRALSSVTRVRIVQLLEDGPQEVQALVAATGLHPNTVRQHLDVLERAELVVRLPAVPSGPGRPPVRYALPAAPAPQRSEAVDRWLLEVLAASVHELAADAAGVVEATARTVGRGRVPAPAGTEDDPTEAGLRAVVELLGELGFAPEVDRDPAAGRAQVRLRRCPFDDLARRYGDIVCTAHLGLIRGALAEVGASVSADLRPFVEPALCVVDLGPPATAPDPGA